MALRVPTSALPVISVARSIFRRPNHRGRHDSLTPGTLENDVLERPRFNETERVLTYDPQHRPYGKGAVIRRCLFHGAFHQAGELPTNPSGITLKAERFVHQETRAEDPDETGLRPKGTESRLV